MKKNKAYKYRIYPNKSQRSLIELNFKCTRAIWNLMLDDRQNEYKEYKQTRKHRKLLTPAGFKTQYPFLKAADSLALAYEWLNLKVAFGRFFNHLCRYPRYKSTKIWKESYTTKMVYNNIKLIGNRLKLPKIDGIKVKLHRTIPASHRIKSVTISKDSANRYYASILAEYETDIKPCIVNSAIGLDYSMPRMFISSDSHTKVDDTQIHDYRKAENRLSFLKRRLSKKQKGSNRYLKYKARVARFESHLSNKRKDYAHKLSRFLASHYDLVSVEDLNMKAMSRAFHFGKSIADNGWGQFLGFLKYKLEDRGKKLVRISKWYPSSKRCHNCGYINHGLTLKDRAWICPSCHKTIDRDYNAALNIRDEGMRLAK